MKSFFRLTPLVIFQSCSLIVLFLTVMTAVTVIITNEANIFNVLFFVISILSFMLCGFTCVFFFLQSNR